MRTRHAGNRQAGLTLIELLIVLSLIGIGAGLGARSFQQYRDGQQARAGVTRLLSVIQYAKARSSATNEHIVLDFAPGGASPQDGFVELFQDLDRDRFADPGEAQAAALPNAESYGSRVGFVFPPDLSVAGTAVGAGPLGQATAADGVPFTNNQLVVYPDGTLSEAGVLTLVDKYSQVYAITASAGGGVRTWIHAGGSWR